MKDEAVVLVLDDGETWGGSQGTLQVLTAEQIRAAEDGELEDAGEVPADLTVDLDKLILALAETYMALPRSVQDVMSPKFAGAVLRINGERT